MIELDKHFSLNISPEIVDKLASTPLGALFEDVIQQW